MKKTYIAPSATVFDLEMENNLLLGSLGTNESDPGNETGASDALSSNHGGWNSNLWSTMNDDK